MAFRKEGDTSDKERIIEVTVVRSPIPIATTHQSPDSGTANYNNSSDVL